MRPVAVCASVLPYSCIEGYILEVDLMHVLCLLCEGEKNSHPD